MYDIVIVGAGVVGGMIARELARYDLKICILEITGIYLEKHQIFARRISNTPHLAEKDLANGVLVYDLDDDSFCRMACVRL